MYNTPIEVECVFRALQGPLKPHWRLLANRSVNPHSTSMGVYIQFGPYTHPMGSGRPPWAAGELSNYVKLINKKWEDTRLSNNMLLTSNICNYWRRHKISIQSLERGNNSIKLGKRLSIKKDWDMFSILLNEDGTTWLTLSERALILSYIDSHINGTTKIFAWCHPVPNAYINSMVVYSCVINHFTDQLPILFQKMWNFKIGIFKYQLRTTQL